MPDPASRIAGAADLLADAWRRGTRLALPADFVPRDLEEGVAIQDELARRLGFDWVGWKIALSSPAGQAREGFTHPFTGRLLRGWVRTSPASFPDGSFNQPLIEGEIAFRIAKGLPARAKPYERGEVLDAVASAFVGVEIPDVRYSTSWPFSMPLLAADNGATAGYVVGPLIADWRTRDLAAIEGSLEIDGKPAAGNLAGAERTDALAILVWAANELSARGYPLRPDDIVTTGSITKPTRCNPGSSAVVRFSGVGDVAFTI